MATPKDHDGHTQDHLPESDQDLSRSDAPHAPELHNADKPAPEHSAAELNADKPVPEHSAGAPAAKPASPPQVIPPAKPIPETSPVSPTSDDDDELIPRGKVTQTIVGGGPKGATRPR